MRSLVDILVWKVLASRIDGLGETFMQPRNSSSLVDDTTKHSLVEDALIFSQSSRCDGPTWSRQALKVLAL
jgi:hypothetical protein